MNLITKNTTTFDILFKIRVFKDYIKILLCFLPFVHALSVTTIRDFHFKKYVLSLIFKERTNIVFMSLSIVDFVVERNSIFDRH